MPYYFYLQVPLLVSNISEMQNRILEEIQNLNFVKDNNATFIERKLSFEKRKPGQIPVSVVTFMAIMAVNSLPFKNYNTLFPISLISL